LNAELWIQGQTDRKNGRNPGLVGVGRVPNSQNGLAPLASSTPELNGPVYVQEGGTSLLDEDTAHFAKLHIPFILAREQMKTMVFFDLIDLFAECRLSDVQPFGSPSEIHLLGQDKDCL